MQKRIWIALVLAAGVLVGCDGDDPAPGGGGGGGGTLALSTQDQPGVLPCPAQTILTDAVELTALKDALQSGTYTYRDVPFDAGDADIFRKKCGLGVFWNPAASTEEIPAPAPLNLMTAYAAGNSGICATGFDNTSFGTGEGFPVAGTYRKEFKVAHMGATYLVRLRVTVTGTSAGNKFTDEGLNNPPDFLNELFYEVDGTTTPHADVANAIIAALTVVADTAPNATLGVKKSAGGAVVWQAKIEFICVAVLAS
ncbi:MAG: hypothetical protein ACYS0K_20565 [Planctomycetota bacterium]|jgi:hypothetical protein